MPSRAHYERTPPPDNENATHRLTAIEPVCSDAVRRLGYALTGTLRTHAATRQRRCYPSCGRRQSTGLSIDGTKFEAMRPKREDGQPRYPWHWRSSYLRSSVFICGCTKTGPRVHWLPGWPATRKNRVAVFALRTSPQHDSMKSRRTENGLSNSYTS
jgi:hypothetical protein